ncbi:MAG: protein kinase [Gemmataceae bacterium]
MSWSRERDDEPLPGYRLIEPLGSGGFGEVWSCTAPGGLLKAIKFVYGNLNSDDADSARAEQEKNALKRIREVRHPFVVSMDQIQEVNGELLIVMELADRSLHDCFVEWQQKGERGIPRDRLIRYLTDAAEGLDYLIGHFNLLHLDVKPRNLFLVADRVKVADFGLVKNIERPSSAGVMAGVTPIYAAPETFQNNISRYSDQYSLGIVYVELLTGKRPFQGKNVRQIALQHMTEPPNLEGLSPSDRAAVARALSKIPEKRFPNCLAFLRALSQSTRSTTDLDQIPEIDGSDEIDLGQHAATEADPPSVVEGEPPPTMDLKDAARAALSAVRGPKDSAGVALQDTPQPLSRPVLDQRIRVAPPQRDGVLRPTLFIGVGAFGRYALLEQRTRLLDRFGDLERLPAFRFLYLDSDPDAAQKATAGTSEIVLSANEVFPMPLQAVGNYRRKTIEQLMEWLPREKLYSIPRSLQPLGSRALGRLAYADSYLRLQARIRRELSTATHPDALQQSAAQSQLPAGDPSPVVVVLAGATDGMSGLVCDLGYGIRRLLDQLAYSYATTEAMVYCGAPFDPATPSSEQANLYATLTELNHYASSGISFIAQYSADSPPIVDPRPAFDRTTLVMRRDRTQIAFRECLSQCSTFLTQIVATPLGALVDQQTAAVAPGQLAPFRGFGTSTAWYPRGLLLRVAARRACEQVLEIWRSTGEANARSEAEARATRAFADEGLQPDRLAATLNQFAATPGEGTPTEATERFLQGLEVLGAGAEEIGLWSGQALDRVREWAGPGSGFDPESTWKKSRFFRTLQMAAARLSEEWDENLTTKAMKSLRIPGARLANGEVAIRKLIALVDNAIQIQLQIIEKHYEGTLAVRDGLVAAQATCAGGGGFKLFGSSQRSLRNFLTQLGQFAKLRVSQDLLEAVLIFLRSLRGRLEDRIKDLGFSRQRLKALEQLLASAGGDELSGDVRADLEMSPRPAHDAFWAAVQGSETVEIIIPGRVGDLETSASQFIGELQQSHWLELDQHLNERVLKPLGNLLAACTGNTNLLKYLGRPLLEATAEYLGAILPIEDVAQAEFSASRGPDASLAEEFFKLHAVAAPSIGATEGDATLSYLMVPSSEAGLSLGQEAQNALPGLTVVPTNAPTELTFCRVATGLSEADLHQLLNLSRLAYQETAPQDAASPHARFDVKEWQPLEP